MTVKTNTFAWILLGLLICPPLVDAKHDKAKEEVTGKGPAVLWREPVDLAARDLFYGIGGKDHAPVQAGTFKFLKEVLDGTNPKFDVEDQNGVKWKVKIGPEVRPETAASRLVWAVGYFTNEDYFVPTMKVSGMPARLHRGCKLVAPDGSVSSVRLKRQEKGEKKLGNWQWRQSDFRDKREWNGLRVLMALTNNWDLKDENNAVYQAGDERIYMISDLGATFGTPGRNWPNQKAKGNLTSYCQSPFIRKVHGDRVDFAAPARPSLLILASPRSYFSRLRLEWIGRNVPVQDARWMGQLLARLSPEQIHDAFRAAGYSDSDIEGFSRVVQQRIAELTRL